MQDWVFEVVHVRVFKSVRVWEDCRWRVLVSILWVARFVFLSFCFFFSFCVNLFALLFDYHYFTNSDSGFPTSSTFFFSFLEFCLRVFNIRLLVCGSTLLISFFLRLSLLPLMKCQFFHYICCPMKSSFWVNWSCPGDLFCIFGFLTSFALFYLSLSLSHTHTHTCLLLWCEYLVWQISWLKCPLSLIAWSHEAGAIQTSHSDWNWNMVPKPSMGLNKMNDPYLGSFWERIFLVGWW